MAAAIGGAVIGGVAALAALIVIGLLVDIPADGPVRGTYPSLAEGTDPAAVGDCLSSRLSLADVTTTEQVVPCRDRHESEVIGLATIPDVSGRPGDEALDLFVSEACGLHLRSYVGSSPDSTGLDYGGVVPDAGAWRSGDRRVWCLVDGRDYQDGIGSARDSDA
ncbi:MAG: septum formation family protein [Acidimicrobiia bacterium]|nr:septum formation family protein [Acidimicrobiia bacterium]